MQGRDTLGKGANHDLGRKEQKTQEFTLLLRMTYLQLKTYELFNSTIVHLVF